MLFLVLILSTKNTEKVVCPFKNRHNIQHHYIFSIHLELFGSMLVINMCACI